MILTLSPIASTRTTTISVDGDHITVDGVLHDLSVLPNNCIAQAQEPAVGVIARQDGTLSLTILYHYDSTQAESIQSANPADYIVEIVQGDVPSPIRWKPVEPAHPTDYDEPEVLEPNDEESDHVAA